MEIANPTCLWYENYPRIFLKSMNLHQRFADNFRLYGSIRLSACPVCDSAEIAELWKIPQTRLEKRAVLDAPGAPYHGYYLDYLPTLKVPQEIFQFDICGNCESIFLNPRDDDRAMWMADSERVNKCKSGGLEGYRDTAETVRKGFPSQTRRVVDAACGAGQTLALFREADPQLELTGLELSKPSVDFVNSHFGITAFHVDLDNDDLDSLVPPGSVDFICFQEAFEHVQRPLVSMRKLMRMLRSGGRLYFTAQFYGDNSLQIRVTEPIYINDYGFDYVIRNIGAKIISLKKDVKIRAFIEKP